MKTQWWRSLLWLLGLFFRLFAPLMALGWPVLAVYGALSPNASDKGALKMAPRETAILIGVAGGSKCDTSGCQSQRWRRSYLVLPRFFVRPSGFTVEDGRDGPRVDEQPGAALVVVLIWVTCAWGTWHYWGRPTRISPSSTDGMGIE
jgi:hypothetical protein